MSQLIEYGDILPILVVMRLDHYASVIEFPGREILPHHRLITTILNAAVMVRFGLRSNFSCEGGVEGVFCLRPHYRERYIELRNSHRCLGLEIGEPYMAQDSHVFRVLEWHFYLMWSLTYHSFRVGKKVWPRGSLFRKELTETDVTLLLYKALVRKMGSKERARSVFAEIEKGKSTLLGLGLAGLTDEDIAQMYVPHPLV